MGTCNFWTMDDFDLVVMSDEKICQNFLGDEFIEERKAELEDYDPIDDIELAWELFNEDIEEWSGIDDLNNSLCWYKVELKSGYYDGVQFYIDTDFLGIDEIATWLPSKPLVWDDDECMLEFGLTREETKQMIEEEKKRINNFLDKMVEYGWERIRCVGVFNNGEAVYELA